YHFEIPMITTNVGGLKETIGDTNTGIIVDKIEPRAIVLAIKEYFAEDNNFTGAAKTRTEMIENIKKEKERLSWSNFCNKLEEFWKTL
ncbi:MAG: glycosyltransferase, partial [Bacteroidales bacterium]